MRADRYIRIEVAIIMMLLVGCWSLSAQRSRVVDGIYQGVVSEQVVYIQERWQEERQEDWDLLVYNPINAVHTLVAREVTLRSVVLHPEQGMIYYAKDTTLYVYDMAAQSSLPVRTLGANCLGFDLSVGADTLFAVYAMGNGEEALVEFTEASAEKPFFKTTLVLSRAARSVGTGYVASRGAEVVVKVDNILGSVVKNLYNWRFHRITNLCEHFAVGSRSLLYSLNLFDKENKPLYLFNLERETTKTIPPIRPPDKTPTAYRLLRGDTHYFWVEKNRILMLEDDNWQELVEMTWHEAELFSIKIYPGLGAEQFAVVMNP